MIGVISDIRWEPTGEENKHLVGGVIVVCHQHREVCAPRPTLAGFISKLALELVQCLIQLVLCHQVASIMAQLEERRLGNRVSEYTKQTNTTKRASSVC